MIPLTNNSEFEIHGKRFRFTYPPKELRAALHATPARPPKRTPRLSMIQSTQVFSPRPSADPRENLRILKSPLKNVFKSPHKTGLSTPLRKNLFPVSSKYIYQSPAKPMRVAAPVEEDNDVEDGDEEESIVLVDGNHPRVVEDDKDLVILEDVVVEPEPEPEPEPPAPQLLAPPQTPARKRSLSRNSLHRAVLIRSAQRAVLKAEREERQREEEEEEEMEVLDAVASDPISGSDEELPMDEENEYEEQEVALAGASDEDKNSDDDDDDETPGKQKQKLTWRKSFERLWPFRSSSTGPNEDEEQEEDSEEDEQDTPIESEAEEQEENDDLQTPLPPQQTPARRPLGSFMTPQVYPRSKVSAASKRPDEQAMQGGRLSLGGGEARRVVRSDQVWKVRDIVVPDTPAAAPPANIASNKNMFAVPATASPIRQTARKVIDEEERKAIQERRRSAVRETEKFFPGGVPGMGSPNKPLGWSPAKTSSTHGSSTGTTSTAVSPNKPSMASRLTREDEHEEEADEALDTRSLLERMKETVEGMKRRRSLAPPTTLFQGETQATPTLEMNMGLTSRPVSPSKTATITMMGVTEEEEEIEQDKEQNEPVVPGLHAEQEVVKGVSEEPAFALLRARALEELRAKEEITHVDETIVPGVEDVPMDVDPVENLVEDVPILPDENLEADMEVAHPILAAETDIPMEEAEELAVSESEVEEPRIEEKEDLVVSEPEVEVPGVQEPEVDESEPGEPEVEHSTPEVPEQDTRAAVKSKLKAPPRRTRTKPADEDGTSEKIELPAAVRRGRRTATPVEEAEPPAPVRAPVKRTLTRKATTVEAEETPAAGPARGGRKAVTTPEDGGKKAAPARKTRKPAATVADSAEDAPAPVRRVRKAAVPVEAPENDEDTPEPPRRGRAPRTATTAIPVRKPAARSKAGAEESPGAAVASGSGGARRGTKAKPIQVDEDADPLDSIDVEEDPGPPKARGRKKVIKEEEVVKEESIETPAIAGPAKTKAKPTLKTPAVRARPAAKKTPVTAPPAVNKENAPGAEEASEESVKVRVSRTTRKTASGAAPTKTTKVKQEEEEETVAEPEAPRGRVMRATRARTRT
ncbi:hypothetical protein H0H81_006835 [Sphagnurus paluster]|uniref:Uncharacterized protein n=1 Tax=Sphagnurus paluster TaxID=117069 RepID=A0A9P7GL01_9AGAR|nr:hypothetical protein H0H81_006835 [Sphagnurus paluster]